MKLLQRTKYWLQSFPTFIEIIRLNSGIKIVQYTDYDIHRVSRNRVSRIHARIVVKWAIFLPIKLAESWIKELMNLQKTKHFKKSVRNYYQFWWLLSLPFLKKLQFILNKKLYSCYQLEFILQFYLWQPESYSKNRPGLW